MKNNKKSKREEISKGLFIVRRSVAARNSNSLILRIIDLTREFWENKYNSGQIKKYIDNKSFAILGVGENSPPSPCPPTRPNYSYSGPPNPCSRGNERAWRKARNKTRLPTMHAKMCGKIQRAVVVCACAQSLITTQSDLIFYMSNYFSCVS